MCLTEVELPNIGYPEEPRPELPKSVFDNRLKRLRKRMAKQNLDAMVIYGDREHFANVHYLTNYDPRFEETLLLVLPQGRPKLFVGNEGLGYSKIARLDVERVLYQPFSLLGQPRDKVEPLNRLLRSAGLQDCLRVGVVGSKYFSKIEFDAPEGVFDLPEFIMTSLRRAVSPATVITNETAMFMSATTGLRNILEPEQIADFEWVATCNSQGLLDGICSLEPGMSEHEAFKKMGYNGLALSCHPLCTSGESCLKYGMASATSRILSTGDPVLMTLTYRGTNCCRFGWLARDSSELAQEVSDYIDIVAAPYAKALSNWYETMCIGATGDSLHHAVFDLLPSKFNLQLNAGHQIASDEWTNSLVYAKSEEKISNGMYWQADFFPTAGKTYHGAFAEDGLVIADDKLRLELQTRYPAMWKRIMTRQAFMRDQLGISISDDILPLSNIQGAVIPFFLTPNLVLTCK